MKARVITSRADPALSEQWAQMTKDVLVPASKSRDGYCGYVAFFNRETGEAVAVTLWRDEESQRASDEASAPSRQAFADSVGAQLSVDYFDVAVVDVPQSG